MTLDMERALEQAEHLMGVCEAPQCEVFTKKGKSRQFTFSTDRGKTEFGLATQAVEELGHTIRLGDEYSSLATCATGWPEPSGLKLSRSPGSLSLPTKETVAQVVQDTVASPRLQSHGTTANLDLDRPLLSESEGRRVIDALFEHLHGELDLPFRLEGRLEDGSSESLLVNGHGVRAHQRARSSSLRVQLCADDQVVISYLGGAPGTIRPRAIAQRMVDKLTIGLRASPPRFQRSAALLAPELISALISAVTPLFLHPVRPPHASAFSNAVSLSDHPTLAGAVVFATCDGEGVPTRRTVLVEKGTPVHWLRPWNAQRGTPRRDRDNRPGVEQTPITGCRFRRGWRDLPSRSISNLVLEPSEEAPGAMLAALENGVYLIGGDQIPGLDSAGMLSLSAVGFEIKGGALGQPVRCRLELPASQLFNRIEAVGRDLQQSVIGGTIAAPTTLLSEVRLVKEAS